MKIVSDTQTEISAIDSVESMQAIENEQLGEIAKEIRSKLEKVILNV